MISIVICTYNPREDYLTRVIESIMRQDFERSEVDFFIIDNNSSFPVEELLPVRRANVRVIAERKPGLTAARERAARSARGEIIVFVDDDNVIDISYLRRATEIFSNPEVGMVSGAVEPEYEVRPERWFKQFEETIAIRRFPVAHQHFTRDPRFDRFFPIGAGMVCRRHIIVDYFDSLTDGNRIEGRMEQRLSSGEDLDLAFFTLHRGFKIGSVGLLRLVHLIPTQRCTPDYVKRLVVSSLISSHQINRKWKPVFGVDVFSVFSVPQVVTLIKMFAHLIRSFRPSSLVLFHFHRALLRINAVENSSK